MSATPLFSLLMLTWNRKQDTLESLRSLKCLDYPDFEIVVVDNNSTDGVDRDIEREFPEVRLIRMPKNLGVAMGRNVAVKNARGEFVFFVDNDGVLEPQSLAKCLELFKADPSLAVVTGKVINYFLKRISETDWVHPVDKDSYADREFYSPVFVGCCACIRKSVLDRVGLFPDDFFRQDEEADLCYRILDAGFKIQYSPEVVFHHKQSPTQRSLPFQYYNTTKNNLSMVWRYLPWPLAVKQTSIRAVVLAFRGAQKGFLLAYLKGFWGFLMELPAILSKRKRIRGETVSEVGRLWGQSGKLIYRILW